MIKKITHYGSIISLIALITVCILWEGFFAPLRPGGSFLILKALPLLIPLFGILKEKIYTYQWSSMFILLYFTEGAMRSYTDIGLSQTFAILETLFSIVFFCCVVLYIRSLRQIKH